MSWDLVDFNEVLGTEKGSLVSGPFGSNIGSRFFVEEGVPVIRGNNLTKGVQKFRDEGFVYLTERKAAEFPNCVAIEDDLVFTAAGSIGQVGIIPRERNYDSYIISNKQIRARLDRTKADPDFMYFWFSSQRMVRYIESQNNGGAVPLLNMGLIRKLPVPIPPLKTQQRISSLLSSYSDLIDNNRRRIALLEDAARQLYKEWFVRFRFPGHEHVKIVDGVPEGWQQKTLGDVAVTNELSHKAKELPPLINYIDIASVDQGWINQKTAMPSDESPGRARRIARHGDVIWSNVRPNLRAYALVMEPEEIDVFSTGFTVLKAKSVPYLYLYEFVTTDSFVSHLVNHTTGASYPAVRPPDFERAEMLVPTDALLGQFQEICEPSFHLICTLQKENKALAQARDLLLPKLMSGEIAV